MSLNLTIELIAFNSDLERFADIYGDCIETEDIQDLTKRFWAIVPLKALKVVNTADSVGDAFDYLDILAQETQAEALQKIGVIQGKTRKGLEELAKINYSINKGWFDDWLEFESNYTNLLNNNALKNYDAIRLSKDHETDKARMLEVRRMVAERVGDLLFEDIKDLSCDIVERGEVLKEFAQEYEPNFKESEYFEAFETGFKCKTWGELFQFMANWANELVLCDFDCEDFPTPAETSPRDYLYLLGGLMVWA